MGKIEKYLEKIYIIWCICSGHTRYMQRSAGLKDIQNVWKTPSTKWSNHLMPCSVDHSTYADSTSAVRFHSPNLFVDFHSLLFWNFLRTWRIRDCVETHLCDSVRQCRKGCINGWADSRGSWPSRPATASIYFCWWIFTKQARTFYVFFFYSKSVFFFLLHVTIGGPQFGSARTVSKTCNWSTPSCSRSTKARVLSASDLAVEPSHFYGDFCVKKMARTSPRSRCGWLW